MPKVRTKRAELTPGVTFIDIDQSGMVIMRGADHTAVEVKGAFVKFQPTIRSSERASVDSKAVRDSLLAAGAAAVVVAPVVVPDSTEDVRNPARPIPGVSGRSAEQHLEEWLASVKAPDDVKLDALYEANASIDEAGL
jgi:hypothetical protein